MPLPFSHPIFDIQNTTGIDNISAKKAGWCMLNFSLTALLLLRNAIKSIVNPKESLSRINVVWWGNLWPWARADDKLSWQNTCTDFYQNCHVYLSTWVQIWMPTQQHTVKVFFILLIIKKSISKLKKLFKSAFADFSYDKMYRDLSVMRKTLVSRKVHSAFKILEQRLSYPATALKHKRRQVGEGM